MNVARFDKLFKLSFLVPTLFALGLLLLSKRLLPAVAHESLQNGGEMEH